MSEIDISDWEKIIEVRKTAQKAIEEDRTKGLVGSSLQAELDIYADKEYFDALKRCGDDLRFIMITSRAEVHDLKTWVASKAADTNLSDFQENLLETLNEASLRIESKPSDDPKCDRCWHYRADVGADAEHPSICGRCVSNLFGAGEARSHA
jgi:isoleucyl-tRNA synthetase